MNRLAWIRGLKRAVAIASGKLRWNIVLRPEARAFLKPASDRVVSRKSYANSWQRTSGTRR